MKHLVVVLLIVCLIFAFVGCNSDKSITQQATQYTLTVAISPTSGGSVAKSPNQNQYDSGTAVILTASPASGYQFIRWEGDVTGTANSTTVTMNGNKNVTAVFSTVSSQYTLTVAVSPTNGGSVTKSPNQSQYASGTTVTLTASPVSSYQFTRWEGDMTGTANPATVTMNGNKNITAVFTTLPPTSLTAYASYDNGLLTSSLDSRPANTVYSNSVIGVGIDYAWAITGGYNSSIVASAIKFNVQSQIVGRSIASATLRLYVYALRGDFTITPRIRVNAFSVDWNPNTLTFNTWANMRPYISGQVEMNAPSNGVLPLDFDVTTIVRNWASGTWANYGFSLSPQNHDYPGYSSLQTTYFQSLEKYYALNQRPQLIIQFQ